MRHIFLDTRDGRLALYLNGELQFDQCDEHLYHEPLALVPTALASRRRPGLPLRVLILGGGDGLALREVLRFSEVAEAHVVDRDRQVLRLGAEGLAHLNREAFRDHRVHTHALDARRFLRTARGFDILICDLTYPRDMTGASLFNIASFRRMRASLRPGGILALNAVSPELTPQAFGCIGKTLSAAGLWAVPYAFVLPSFMREGYGRWGFYFASSRPLLDEEFRKLILPDGAGLTPGDLLSRMQLPAAAIDAMDVAPNRTDELLHSLYNASPVRWEGLPRPHCFAPSKRSACRTPHPGPQLTAAQTFSRWLRHEEGRRSLDELLACLPLAQRGPTREALIEWSRRIEALIRGVEIQAFIEQLLRRANELPVVWVRELRELRERIRDGWPSGDELLHLAHRVLAILLLVLVLANLFFPDNLYAKGFSGSSSHSSGSSSSYSSHSFFFSNPDTRFSPYRSRSTYAGGRFYAFHSSTSPSWVYDSQGREYPALRFAFTDPQGGQQPIASLLALTKDLQLLESSGIAYTASVPGYRFLLDPGRLRVLAGTGVEVMALLPDAGLREDVKRQLRAQGPLIERAITDHQRWLDWVRWASMTAGGQQAASELAALEAIKRAVATARETWEGVASPPAPVAGAGWVSIFPGVYLEPPRPDPAARSAVFVTPEGTVRTRTIAPPVALTAEDRFLFFVLNRRLTEGRDQSLSGLIARWVEVHGEALGIRRSPSPAAGRQS
jgi:spermidine synthase